MTNIAPRLTYKNTSKRPSANDAPTHGEKASGVKIGSVAKPWPPAATTFTSNAGVWVERSDARSHAKPAQGRPAGLTSPPGAKPPTVVAAVAGDEASVPTRAPRVG